jgi:hypothetical protein
MFGQISWNLPENRRARILVAPARFVSFFFDPVDAAGSMSEALAS